VLRLAWSYIGHASTIHWLASIGITVAAGFWAFGKQFFTGLDTVPRIGVISGLSMVALALSLALMHWLLPPPAPSYAELEACRSAVEQEKALVPRSIIRSSFGRGPLAGSLGLLACAVTAMMAAARVYDFLRHAEPPLVPATEARPLGVLGPIELRPMQAPDEQASRRV
jgi:hypothetical protein